ncbi:hypothetical protein ACS127_15905 [Amphibacillus sp. Q70]|uniref:hypothetical protein n=1 Tax=Amphibacillus sp. Q70 TaxID=3453416 RepID=UPI003F87726D
MIKWNRTYTLLSIIVVLFLIAIWYYGQLYLLEPERQLIEKSEETLAQQQTLLTSPHLEGLSKDALETEAENIHSQLPTDKNVDQIMLLLNDLEEQSDVTIHHVELINGSLATDQPYYPNDIANIRYQIHFSTEIFADFELFISELNDLIRVVEIDQLTFQETATAGISASVTFRAFYSENNRLN